MTHPNVPERAHVNRKGPGRRENDGNCSEHPFIQEATKESRARVCSKIAALNAEVKGMVSWKVFAFLFGFSVLVVGSGFGFFGASISKLGDKHEAAMDRLENTVSGMASTQAVMMTKMSAIEARQDILRDQNIKIMQEKK